MDLMREVTLRWEREALASTSMAALDEIVSRLSILGNLHISPDGVRQLIAPVYREGKNVDDLTAVDFIEVKEVLSEREQNALVIFNTHPLVRMATNTQDIHILVPVPTKTGNLPSRFGDCPKPWRNLFD